MKTDQVNRHPDSASSALARRMMRMFKDKHVDLSNIPPLYPKPKPSPDLRQRPATIERVIRSACDQFSVLRRELLSPSRTQNVAAARGVACRQLRDMGLSFKEIATYLNMEHHTGPIYHCSKGTIE